MLMAKKLLFNRNTLNGINIKGKSGAPILQAFCNLVPYHNLVSQSSALLNPIQYQYFFTLL
jgi:hypothetical protein